MGRTVGALAHDLDGLRASVGGACVGAAKPIVAHLAYPGRRSVTVWVGTAGCRYAINGALTRPASSSVVHELERLAG